ncbi:AAA family ATPase [Sulfitobacter sp. M57]|uniref:TniB family NTP-binding protein n=1 Tax=unclassified Sulfitobacter TaxID=196795 RepID=UPI0023E1B59B|nr:MULTISPECIES: TniB family NTP-binding protein [unclassified Sulfitobacter]MDF3414426.1 AAA family ATPase [Sulfitobacter sp. KE5]MDF3421907.1 AAA family ATPase [Sulfitobacter sp. KE43]MDF3432972.1 AAA family ATPase [Sulfitobacter sp. KE42]MDF3458612.1 AAA family ATPase [Sulfitobacter sp. S74]MDF3462512.1 AAA family ATPase [Sulfitobacter sp. Ks18]
MTTTNNEIRKTIQYLRSTYLVTPSYQKLETHFHNLLEQRRADMADGMMNNARGIVVVGQSGSGKTTAIRELIRKNKALLMTDTTQDHCEFFGLQVPSPATMKFVGAATLRALGYPYSGDKQGPAIWDQVKVQLKLRQTCFLHLDEAQDLARYQTDKERQSVVNTLKSVMENSYWPTGLVLSGMPDLKKIVNQDPQLSRRLYPVEIGRLHAIRDVAPVLGTIQQYAAKAKIETLPSVRNEVFAQRLMHAADYEFGLMAEITVQAFAKALQSDGFEAKLEAKHFADVFYERSAAIDGLNPFIAEDFARINPRQIFEFDGEEA